MFHESLPLAKVPPERSPSNFGHNKRALQLAFGALRQCATQFTPQSPVARSRPVLSLLLFCVCMCVCVRAHCVCIRCHSARAPGLSRLSARARTPDHLRVCASRRKSRFLGSFSGLKPPATMAGRRDVLHANQHAGHPGGAVSSGPSQKRVHPPRPGPVFGARNRNRPVPKWTAEARATPQTSYH